MSLQASISQPGNTGLERTLSCNHEYINEGVCVSCGTVCTQLFSDDPGYASGRNADRSILKEMDNLAVSDEAKLMAESIFMKLNPLTKRGNRRKQLIFFCLYYAYIELGQPQDPKKIAQLVGIKPSGITKAFSMFSQAQTGYKPPTLYITPIHLIPQYCDNLHLTRETTQDVMTFAQTILDKDINLKEKFPQKVAAGILLYYLTINGCTLNRKEFAKNIGLSEVTISNVFKQIAAIHNGSKDSPSPPSSIATASNSAETLKTEGNVSSS
jgi:transcription initiation factor TFIIIB Brf1 subunit/transcription initiation factor TFIIB